MKLLHLDRARAEGAARQPAPLPYQTVGFANVTQPIHGPRRARPGMGRVIPHSGQTVLSKGAGRGRAFGPSIAVHCNNREIRGIYGNLSCTSRKEAG